MAAAVDPALVALIADPRMALRRCPPHIAFERLRAAANGFQASMPRPAIAAVEDFAVAGVAGQIGVRLYRPTLAPSLPVIVFAHGGGFLFGDLETHDAMCRTLANGSDAVVAAIDYRLCPETSFPAPLVDIADVVAWLVANGAAIGLDCDRLALAGDSAGGQLVAATAIGWDHRRPPLRHVGLLYPLLDPAADSDSARQFAEGHMLTGEFVGWAWEAYRNGAGCAEDPRFDLSRADLAAFPPSTIITAELDPLRDEGEAFGKRLGNYGIDVVVERVPGMIHGFAGLPQTQRQAETAIGLVAARIGAALHR